MFTSKTRPALAAAPQKSTKVPIYNEFPEKVDPKRINSSPWQPDSRTDEATLHDLKRSIKEEGILESIPLTAIPFRGDPNDNAVQQKIICVRGQYYDVEALGGHRRTEVAILLGFEEVPVHWIETRSEEDRKKKFMELNVTAHKLTPKHSAEIVIKGGSLRPGNHKSSISKVLNVGGPELLKEITEKYSRSPGMINSVQKFMRATVGHEMDIKEVTRWMAKLGNANVISSFVSVPLDENDIHELIAAFEEERNPIRRRK